VNPLPPANPPSQKKYRLGEFVREITVVPPFPSRRGGLTSTPLFGDRGYPPVTPLLGAGSLQPPCPYPETGGIHPLLPSLGAGSLQPPLSLSGDRGYPPITPLFGGGLPSTPLSLSGDRGYPPVTPFLWAGFLQPPCPNPETGGIHLAVSKFADVFITGWTLTPDQGGLTSWPPQFQEPRLPLPEFLVFSDSEARIHTQV
jgi:hypothetical protein